MAAKPTKTPAKQPLFNVRISGQIRASNVSNAAALLVMALEDGLPPAPDKCANCQGALTDDAKFCPNCGKPIALNSGPLEEGGIIRITPAEGA